MCIHLHHDNRVGYAKVAQLVERDLAKVEVAGSNPVFRSEDISTGNGAFFLIGAKSSQQWLTPGWWNW